MKEPLYRNKTPDSAEAYISSIRSALPAINDVLSRYETTNLRDFVGQLDRRNTAGFQDKHDCISEIANYTRDTLGPELAEVIFAELQEMPRVVTTNHHGIDTFAQSTQTNLMFSLRKGIDGKPAKTIPVLACGSVPLNNLTYPRGLLIYATTEAFGGGGVCKLPIFPDSYKRKLVSVSGPFTGDMLGRARARAKRFVEDEKLARPMESALNLIFDDFTDIGQNYPDYSRQATVANHRFWRRLFREGSCNSDLVYIELEKIAGRLLEKDMLDKSTICHQLMFDPELRGRLIENLDGKRGCWQHGKLLQRCSDPDAADGSGDPGSTCGTLFFWGVDAKGKKVPLCVLEGRTGGNDELRGIDDRGQEWTIPFTPTGITQGLQDGRLLPSIFTSYLLISIARGMNCVGGYYQADYLPKMQKGVIDTLSSRSADTIKTEFFGKLSPDLYLSGMQAVGLKTDRQIRPAGPLEIVASGGLDAQQYEQIGEVTVLQAHIASLFDTIMDTVPDGIDLDRAKTEIAKLVHDTVGNNIVTISME